MKNTMEAILKHPIATVIVLGFTCNCAIRIIKAVKGVEVDPLLKVTVDGNSGA
jgi:hypothetical protein